MRTLIQSVLQRHQHFTNTFGVALFEAVKIFVLSNHTDKKHTGGGGGGGGVMKQRTDGWIYFVTFNNIKSWFQSFVI